jgi:two-component system OmpR family response regulator
VRVLLIEDERDLAAALARALIEAQCAVDVAGDGEDALARATALQYDVIVLDLMLPRIDGWQVLQTLRAAGHREPILLLTARDAVADRVRGLDLGADDYVTKPFALEELVARQRALVRRSADQPAPALTFGSLHIDTVARRVFRAGIEVELTGREYSILEVLTRRQGTVVSRTAISDYLYNDDSELISNAIDVHVAALRRKLGAGVIETRRGLGYLFAADAPRPAP